MEKYMPKSYIPDLIKIESLKEYMLIGCILLGLKKCKSIFEKDIFFIFIFDNCLVRCKQKEYTLLKKKGEVIWII